MGSYSFNPFVLLFAARRCSTDLALLHSYGCAAFFFLWCAFSSYFFYKYPKVSWLSRFHFFITLLSDDS